MSGHADLSDAALAARLDGLADLTRWSMSSDAWQDGPDGPAVVDHVPLMRCRFPTRERGGRRERIGRLHDERGSSMTDLDTPTTPFPIGWNEWRTQLHDWLAAHPEVRAVSKRGTPFAGVDPNLMADEVIGLFRLPSGRLVELSEVTFPDLTRPAWSGERRRYVGVTFDGPGAMSSGDLCESWVDLERQLGVRS